jgi:RimJ/RimL family protein N-acetyltransferase
MNVTLRTAAVSDRDELYAVIDANREHLTNLVWAKSATRLSTEKFLASVPSTETLKVIMLDGRIIGMITLRNEPHPFQSIGYWLAHDVRRQGIMTATVKEILKSVPKNHFVEARVHKNNVASQKVLAANGFVKEFVDISHDGKEWLDLWVYKSKRGFFERLFNVFNFKGVRPVRGVLR